MELLIGVLLPPVIDLVNKRVSSEAMRFLVACAICTIASIGTLWYLGKLNDPGNVTATIAIVFTEAQVIFNLYWKNSFIRGKMMSTPTEAPTADVLPPDGESGQMGNHPFAAFGINPPPLTQREENPPSQ